MDQRPTVSRELLSDVVEGGWCNRIACNRHQYKFLFGVGEFENHLAAVFRSDDEAVNERDLRPSGDKIRRQPSSDRKLDAERKVAFLGTRGRFARRHHQFPWNVWLLRHDPDLPGQSALVHELPKKVLETLGSGFEQLDTRSSQFRYQFRRGRC